MFPQGIDVSLKERIQVSWGCDGCLLLEEVPFGLQDLVLLL